MQYSTKHKLIGISDLILIIIMGVLYVSPEALHMLQKYGHIFTFLLVFFLAMAIVFLTGMFCILLE